MYITEYRRSTSSLAGLQTTTGPYSVARSMRFSLKFCLRKQRKAVEKVSGPDSVSLGLFVGKTTVL